MNDWLCRVCKRSFAKGKPDQTCADCSRHVAYGVIVDSCVGNGVGFDVLDALARLMGITTRLRREHNKEMAGEQRAMQREVSGAYTEGYNDGRGAER